MKRQSRKSQASSTVPNKPPKPTTETQDDELDDSSLDEIFRFDDKLIGKRTNTIFDVKPANDGFFDIIQQNFNSELSFESSNPDYDSSNSIFDNLDISEMEEKKNQKMIRYIRQSNAHDLLDASITEIDEDDDITEDNSSKQKKEKRQESVKQEQKPQQKSKNKLQKVQKKASQPEKKHEKPEKLQKLQPQHDKLQKDFKKAQKTQTELEKKNEKNHVKKQDNKNTGNQTTNVKPMYNSASAKAEKKPHKTDKTPDEKGQPTAEKKSHIVSGEQIPDLEKLNEAKSKARSEDNPKEPNQKVETINQDVVKVEKKFNNRNEIQEKRKEEKQKVLSKDQKVQKSAQKQNPKEQNPKEKKGPQAQNNIKQKEEKSKAAIQKVIQDSKKRRQADFERRRKNPSPTPEVLKNLTKANERRVPRKSAKKEEKEKKIPKFKVNLEIEKPEKGEEYEPFGRMGEEGRYPKRLRIPPLRFWNNERRNYDRGMLSSITLIDDKKGKRVSDMIESQIDAADESD